MTVPLFFLDSTLTVCKYAAMDLPNLSGKEAVVFDLLLGHGAREMYALEMVDAAGGQLGRGTVYVTLGRMKEKGYLESRSEAAPESQGGPPRVLYFASGLGARVYRSWRVARKRWSEGFAT